MVDDSELDGQLALLDVPERPTIDILASILRIQIPHHLQLQGGYLDVSSGELGVPMDLSIALHTGALNPGFGSVADSGWKAIREFSVRFADGRTAMERELRRRFGEPRVAHDLERPYRLYGRFVVDARDSDDFVIHWYDATPDWAAPAATVAAAVWLGELVSVLTTARSTADLADVLSRSAEAGIASDIDRDSFFWLTFSPAIDANELARICDWPQAIATFDTRATDDGVGWKLRIDLGDRTMRPKIGRWLLDVRLEDRPATTIAELRSRVAAPAPKTRDLASYVVRVIEFFA